MQVQKGKKFDKLRSEVAPELLALWESEQRLLREKVIEEETEPLVLRFAAGFDISFSQKYENIAVASLVVVDCNTMATVYQDCLTTKLTLPYVPGLLAFRELGSLLQLWKRFREVKRDCQPDVVLTDGNGILHVNGFGLACHLGVLLDKPCIGCGKTMFYVDGLGKADVAKLGKDLKPKQSAVLQGQSGRKWGAVLRASQDSVNPLIVSVGHRISLHKAVQIVARLCVHRVPQPVRQADKISRSVVDRLSKEQVEQATSFDLRMTGDKYD